jgi:hypothetical protein
MRGANRWRGQTLGLTSLMAELAGRRWPASSWPTAKSTLTMPLSVARLDRGLEPPLAVDRLHRPLGVLGDLAAPVRAEARVVVDRVVGEVLGDRVGADRVILAHPLSKWADSVRRKGEAAKRRRSDPEEEPHELPADSITCTRKQLGKGTNMTTSTLSRLGIRVDLLWGGSCDA